MLPTMLRSVSRSMEYSSSTPFSISATRRSRLSELMMILFARRSQCRDFDFVIALIHRESPLQDMSGDRRRDAAAVMSALYHRANGITRMLERREAAEPCDGVFLAAISRLRAAGLAGH